MDNLKKNTTAHSTSEISLKTSNQTIFWSPILFE